MPESLPAPSGSTPDPTPRNESMHVVCALCVGHGEICNPGNTDPAVAITDWLRPVACPRCGCTGKDPNPRATP